MSRPLVRKGRQFKVLRTPGVLVATKDAVWDKTCRLWRVTSYELGPHGEPGEVAERLFAKRDISVLRRGRRSRK